MSGSTGAPKIKSRLDYDKFVKSYVDNILNSFPSYVYCTNSGSYNSDKNKQEFGDIDLIIQFNTTLNKTLLKKELQGFLLSQSKDIIVEFTSEKYKGKRSLNTGEIVTIRYFDKDLNYSVQIDNIIALSKDELKFKKWFLDLEASRQGLLLGLVKTLFIENDTQELLDRLHFCGLESKYDKNYPKQLSDNKTQEYEFNLSSVGFQLLLVSLETDFKSHYKIIDKQVIFDTNNLDTLLKFLSYLPFNVVNHNIKFETMIDTLKQIDWESPRSINRIKGLFNSMITIKSGEVNTLKGDNKQYTLDLINTL